jgi:hypothetical protein
MSYHDQLHPWCITRLLPNMQRAVVQRFRRRNDAEAHLRLLQQMTPAATYAIIFEATLDPVEQGVGQAVGDRWA